MHILRWLRGLFARSEPKWLTEEEALAADMKRLDEEDPGWDHEARLARAESALERGVPRDAVVGIYGEALVREAEDRARS